MTESQYDLAKLALTELNLPDVTHETCLTILGDSRTKASSLTKIPEVSLRAQFTLPQFRQTTVSLNVRLQM
jgi:hypothetical protein